MLVSFTSEVHLATEGQTIDNGMVCPSSPRMGAIRRKR
jgi:hypothetical protein